MLLIVQDLKSYLISFGSVIVQLDCSPRSHQRIRLSAGATRRGETIQKKELDYPVKPDNDDHGTESAMLLIPKDLKSYLISLILSFWLVQNLSSSTGGFSTGGNDNH
jgi:hypothetical protein